MKKWLPIIITGILALWLAKSLFPPRDKPGQFAVHAFGSLPVLSNGRVQPLDSLARNSLLQMVEKQSVKTTPWEKKSETLSSSAWLIEMMMKPREADTRPVFRIDHPQLKGLLGLPIEANPEQQSDGKNYSWMQIRGKLEELQLESNRVAKLDSSQRNPFDQAVNRLANAIGIYMRLQNTLQPQNAKDWEKEFQTFKANLPAGVASARAQQAGQQFDQAALDRIMGDLERFDAMGRIEPPLLIPPASPEVSRDNWLRVNDALMNVARGEPAPFALEAYVRMAGAYQNGRVAEFNQVVTDYATALQAEHQRELQKATREQYFNVFNPFYNTMVIYLVAGLCALFFWFDPARLDWLRRSAFWLVVLGLVVHTVGLVFRMTLEGRPPVTNLYSSAIFIGFGAVILGLVIEAFWRNSIGVVVASVLGFLTLIIAHHLSRLGDTMEMMRAVLDTNFWLATHVVVVTLGYSATFMAGFLAILFILIGAFTKSMTPDLGKSFAKMVYGVICFATLFTFVGTVLGGIWADQSWGRFWGWDPKENGALIIVLWNALILHAKWGGLVRERGLMNLAIVGNIVTAWSWFGVNMLGIGLHSYGFTDAAFRYLMLFVGSQLLLILIGSVPLRFWRSFPRPPEPAAA